MLMINGAYGEGGGQVLRTSLALAAILGQSICIENIRAGRKNPGLAAQHLTAVKAAALICDAHLAGDKLGSTKLTFEPHCSPRPSFYEFDVAKERTGGSAGAVSLVLQTILIPLALASGPSLVTISGGTHVAWSPSFHYLNDVYLPTIAGLGIQATIELVAWGWYPAGKGQIEMTIPGQMSDMPTIFNEAKPIWLSTKRGPLKQIKGVAIASDLPAHIAQRMSDQAIRLLTTEIETPLIIEPQRVRSVSPGAGIFLVAEYESSWAGFGAIGRKGKPAERVAEEAVNRLLAFHRTDAVIDEHLTDQLILPLALAGLPGALLTERISKHTLTNIWVVEQFLGPVAKINHQNRTIQFIQRDNLLQ